MPKPFAGRHCALLYGLTEKFADIVAEVHGEPVPKERARYTGKGWAYNSAKQRAAEKVLQAKMIEESRVRLIGNVGLACVFYRSTNRRVDIDNLIKFVMDAGNGIWWQDDAQIKAIVARIAIDKTNPRTLIAVCRT